MAHVNEFDHTSNPFTFTGSVQGLELGITKSGELLPNTTSYDYFNSTVSEMIDVDYENTVLRTWTKIYYPLVAFVGITSNVFNLLVLTKKSLIKKSSNVYLVGLAIADILVVVFQATFKYAVFKAYLVRSPQWFYVFLCVHNNSVLIAARRWNFGITAAFTIERYIHIRHPLKGKIWCTPRKAKRRLFFNTQYKSEVHNKMCRSTWLVRGHIANQLWLLSFS